MEMGCRFWASLMAQGLIKLAETLDLSERAYAEISLISSIVDYMAVLSELRPRLTRRLADAQDDISSFDYVVAMDEGNHNELHLACRAWGETFAQMALTKVKLLGSYASYRNHLDPLNRPNGERLSLPEAASFIGAEVSPTAALLVLLVLLVLSSEGSVC